MKIKSSYKDFYDFALSGISEPDNENIYVRELGVLPYKGITRLQDKNEVNYHWIQDNTSGILRPKFLVYFDGEFFGGTQKIEYKRNNYKFEILKEEFIYEDNILDYFKKDKDTIELIKELCKNNPIITLKMFNQVIETCPDLSNQYKNIKQEERDRLRKEATKVVMSNNIEYGTKIVINDSLKNVQFNKILDSFQVYQRIESFVIRKNSIEKEVKFTDKEKRDQHGFDDYSFKNM